MFTLGEGRMFTLLGRGGCSLLGRGRMFTLGERRMFSLGEGEDVSLWGGRGRERMFTFGEWGERKICEWFLIFFSGFWSSFGFLLYSSRTRNLSMVYGSGIVY